MAAITKQPTMLMMSAMSPVMVFANFRTQRKSSKKRGKNELGKWRDAVQRSQQQLADITVAERQTAWRTFADPATVREICRRQDNRLWERRRTDPDALGVRLGVAERPVPVKLDGQFANPDTLPPVMSPVPVAVDLSSARVLGIAGRTADAQALGRWTLLQLASARSPLDLRLIVLCDKSAAPGLGVVALVAAQPGGRGQRAGHDDR